MSVGRPNIVDGGRMSRGKNQAMDGSRTTGVAAAEDPRRWRMLAIVGTGVLLAMAPWFSSSEVAPLLTAEWGLDRLALPALTIAVQLGFAVGAFGLALTAAADVLPSRLLFATGAFLAAGANLGFAFLA